MNQQGDTKVHMRKTGHSFSVDCMYIPPPPNAKHNEIRKQRKILQREITPVMLEWAHCGELSQDNSYYSTKVDKSIHKLAFDLDCSSQSRINGLQSNLYWSHSQGFNIKAYDLLVWLSLLCWSLDGPSNQHNYCCSILRRATVTFHIAYK